MITLYDADRCPYCAAFLENRPQEAEALIPPAGLLPFAVPERQARAAFNDWLAHRWFAPPLQVQISTLVPGVVWLLKASRHIWLPPL